MGWKSLDGSSDIDSELIDEGRGMETAPENPGGDNESSGDDGNSYVDNTRLDTKTGVEKILGNGWHTDDYQERGSPNGTGFTDYDLDDEASGDRGDFGDDDDGI